jgi:hypothetical protein
MCPDPHILSVSLMMDRVGLGQIFLRVVWFSVSTVNISPSRLHIPISSKAGVLKLLIGVPLAVCDLTHSQYHQ